MQSNSNILIHKWSENETKYLLDQYRMYFPQIGPFQAFKNKTAMFEQISKDVFVKFGVKVTGLQCSTRFKNANKQRQNALSRNAVSGNSSTEIPYEDEFEDIASVNDSIEPEVLVGVNYIKSNEKVKAGIGKRNSSTSDTSNSEKSECKNPKKKLKSNSLEDVLKEISAKAELNRDRRHKEKCQLLLSLFGKQA